VKRPSYEWDVDKDRENRLKHGVAFLEAEALLERGAGVLEMYDAEHSLTQDRFVAIGPSAGRLIVVILHRARGRRDPDRERPQGDHQRAKALPGAQRCVTEPVS
jgi:uncharacterized DUF497 family protein